MPVRTQRLAAGITDAANVGKTVYTAPAGETVILKDLRLFARAGALANATVFLLSGTAFVGVLSRPMTDQETAQLQGFMVLLPGDRIVIQCNVNQGLGYWCSGAELEGLAD